MADAFTSTTLPTRAGQIDALEAEANKRDADLGTRMKESGDAAEAELAPLEAAASKQMSGLAELQAPHLQDMPTYQPKPLVSGKDYQGLSMALLGMALIGGATSRGNWMGASASLNGALKGYKEGAQDRAEREYKDYQTKFAEAKAHDDRAQKEFEDILNSKKLSINEMLTQIKLASSKYDRQDVRFAAEQKSIDAIRRQVEASRNSLAQAEERHIRANEGFAVSLQKSATAKQGAADLLNEDGKWLVDQTLAGGNTKFMQLVMSRYGGALAAESMNNVAKELRAKNIDPRTLNESQMNLMVQRSVQTQASNRLAGVTRLTDAMKPLEGELARLVEKVNGKGVRPANATLNWVRSNLGDADYNELVLLMGSVGRQYIEAMTMPGSNAQLHASASEWADGTFNKDMNITALEGVFKGMNLEIASTHKALQTQINTSREAIQAQGPTIAAPGAAPAATPAAGKAVPLDDYLKSQGF